MKARRSGKTKKFLKDKSNAHKLLKSIIEKKDNIKKESGIDIDLDNDQKITIRQVG